MAADMAASDDSHFGFGHEQQRFLADTGDRDMTITIINKGTKRDQQQNGPCPYLVDCPPEPRR